MELTRQPQTEIEYWEAIESLGGFVWSLNHDLGDGRIQDPDGKLDKEIAEMRELSVRLVAEIGEKFGVINPKDTPAVEPGQKLPPPPKGKTYYWPWYVKMKKRSARAQYAKTICSVCPFCRGQNQYRNGMMCRPAKSIMCGRLPADQCLMVMNKDWTEERFFLEIRAKYGDTALVKLLKKLLEARTARYEDILKAWRNRK